jgi:PKD repeat protein
VQGSDGEHTSTKNDYITVYEPPKADFSASPTSGVQPLEVNFTNLSTGDFDQCFWDFGDGNTSDICENLSHTFVDSGVFSVSLEVQGLGGEDTMTKTDYITVYEPPTADFSASPETGAPPLVVDFTNLSTGDFNQCLWEFGDGETQNSCVNPTHEYKNEGQYTVSLAVEGPGGEDTLIVDQCVKVAFYRIYLPVLVMAN